MLPETGGITVERENGSFGRIRIGTGPRRHPAGEIQQEGGSGGDMRFPHFTEAVVSGPGTAHAFGAAAVESGADQVDAEKFHPRCVERRFIRCGVDFLIFNPEPHRVFVETFPVRREHAQPAEIRLFPSSDIRCEPDTVNALVPERSEGEFPPEKSAGTEFELRGLTEQLFFPAVQNLKQQFRADFPVQCVAEAECHFSRRSGRYCKSMIVRVYCQLLPGRGGVADIKEVVDQDVSRPRLVRGIDQMIQREGKGKFGIAGKSGFVKFDPVIPPADGWRKRNGFCQVPAVEFVEEAEPEGAAVPSGIGGEKNGARSAAHLVQTVFMKCRFPARLGECKTEFARPAVIPPGIGHGTEAEMGRRVCAGKSMLLSTAEPAGNIGEIVKQKTGGSACGVRCPEWIHYAAFPVPGSEFVRTAELFRRFPAGVVELDIGPSRVRFGSGEDRSAAGELLNISAFQQNIAGDDEPGDADMVENLHRDHVLSRFQVIFDVPGFRRHVDIRGDAPSIDVDAADVVQSERNRSAFGFFFQLERDPEKACGVRLCGFFVPSPLRSFRRNGGKNGQTEAYGRQEFHLCFLSVVCGMAARDRNESRRMIFSSI